jgi:hypothetical protein
MDGIIWQQNAQMDLIAAEHVHKTTEQQHTPTKHGLNAYFVKQTATPAGTENALFSNVSAVN